MSLDFQLGGTSAPPARKPSRSKIAEAVPAPAVDPFGGATVAQPITPVVEVIQPPVVVVDKAKWALETIDKWSRVAAQAKARFVERDNVIRYFQLCIAAGEHILLNGDPGTAKTDLTKFILNRIAVHAGHPGGRKRNYFEYVMNPTTDPAALVGPYSVKGMEEDRFYRVWRNKGYLPDVLFGYIDEADKANDASLNYLLPIANEKIMHNDGDIESINTHMIAFSANEAFPDKTYALVDRILVQLRVNKIQTRVNFVTAAKAYERHLNPLTRPRDNERITFTAEDILNLHEYTMAVECSEKMIDVLGQIWEKLDRDGFSLSDRRFFKCIKLLKASAASKGRTRVTRTDFDVLLWAMATGAYETQADDIKKVLDEFSSTKVIGEFRQLLTQATTLRDQLMVMPEATDAEKKVKRQRAMDVRKELEALADELGKRLAKASKDGEDTDELEPIKDEVLAIQGTVSDLLAQYLKLPTNMSNSMLNTPF